MINCLNKKTQTLTIHKYKGIDSTNMHLHKNRFNTEIKGSLNFVVNKLCN